MNAASAVSANEGTLDGRIIHQYPAGPPGPPSAVDTIVFHHLGNGAGAINAGENTIRLQAAVGVFPAVYFMVHSELPVLFIN